MNDDQIETIETITTEPTLVDFTTTFSEETFYEGSGEEKDSTFPTEQQLTTEISIDTEYDITEIVTEDVPTSTERGTNKRLLEQYLIV